MWMSAQVVGPDVAITLTVSQTSQELRLLRRIFVQARDLQAAADGYTTVDEIGYVERGYENFEEKLRSLGAVIERVDSEKEAQKFRLESWLRIF